MGHLANCGPLALSGNADLLVGKGRVRVGIALQAAGCQQNIELFAF